MTGPFTPSPELAAIARRWLEAHAARRRDAAANLLSSSDALTFIGSDEGETFTGCDFRETYADFFHDAANLVTEDLVATGYQSGDFGWAWATLSVVSPEAGKRAAFRSSFVFALEDAIWRIVHIHNSNPTPNLETMGYEGRTLDDLVAAADAEDMAFATTGIASVMFTDVADSTTLAAAIGDAAWSRLIRAHFDRVGDQVAAAGGVLVKSLGDGTLSRFPSASAAMTAALAIQRAVADAPSEPQLRLRIGIHTGDVLHSDRDLLGTVVNKAARVAAAARPDEIRVSDATRVMVGGAAGFAFREPVDVPLKGLEGTHLIYRLEWTGPS